MSDHSYINLSAEIENVDKKSFLSDIKGKLNPGKLKEKISKLNGSKVLVIGDAIIDEYAYSEVIERAKKEPILVFRYQKSDFFAGGIFAIANHVSQFSNDVTLLTCIGKDNFTSQLLDKKLDKKIKTKFFFEGEYPTLIKKRYVESYRGHKVFEVYNNPVDLPNLPEDEILDFLKKEIKSYDLVIVGDFGHGTITDKIKEFLSREANFLAVNVQTNSGNFGFNLVTKVSRADLICISKEELQLAMQDRKSDIKDLIKKLSEKSNCSQIAITLGKNGIIFYKSGSFHHVPALADKVVDTIGAGDAVFSILSMLAHKQESPDIIPFIGNCVGSIAVKILGNRDPIKPEDVNKVIDELLA